MFTQGLDARAEVDGWVGSSAWIRRQFSDYLVALLATADHARTLKAPFDGEAMDGVKGIIGRV